MLDLFHIDLVKIIRGYLEGTESKGDIKTEPYKLNVSRYAFNLHSS